MMISFTSEVDDFAESRANYDRDGEIHDIALDRELLKFFQHDADQVLVRDDVDQLFLDAHDLANRLPGGEFLNPFVGQGDFFQFGIRRGDRHGHAIAHFAVHLEDDFHFVFDQIFRRDNPATVAR